MEAGITYGYNWPGKIEGNFTLEGKQIHFRGAGIRERYVTVDSSSAEIGGWEDWGWFHFDEVFGSMYDMRLDMPFKNITVYKGAVAQEV